MCDVAVSKFHLALRHFDVAVFVFHLAERQFEAAHVDCHEELSKCDLEHAHF